MHEIKRGFRFKFPLLFEPLKEIKFECPTCKGKHTYLIKKDAYEGREPFHFLCPDVTRLYRLSSFVIDTTRTLMKQSEIIPTIKQSQSGFRELLKKELGENEFEKKFKRWLNLDYYLLGLIEEYYDLIEQIINTYSSGYFFSAITATGCLGERILNRLMLKTRDYFKSSSEYKQIYRKQSFDNWEQISEILFSWNVLTEEVKKLFVELSVYRNDSVHYKEDYNFETNSKKALDILVKIVTSLFCATKRKDLFWVFDIPGEIWVKSEVKNIPFVREFILPHCYLAHAIHEIDSENKRIIEKNPHIGPLTDEEFIEIRKNYNKKRKENSKNLMNRSR